MSYRQRQARRSRRQKSAEGRYLLPSSEGMGIEAIPIGAKKAPGAFEPQVSGRAPRPSRKAVFTGLWTGRARP